MPGWSRRSPSGTPAVSTPTGTSYRSTADLASALRRAEAAHRERAKTQGGHASFNARPKTRTGPPGTPPTSRLVRLGPTCQPDRSRAHPGRRRRGGRGQPSARAPPARHRDQKPALANRPYGDGVVTPVAPRTRRLHG
jgi:hypothetical protein